MYHLYIYLVGVCVSIFASVQYMSLLNVRTHPYTQHIARKKTCLATQKITCHGAAATTVHSTSIAFILSPAVYGSFHFLFHIVLLYARFTLLFLIYVLGFHFFVYFIVLPSTQKSTTRVSVGSV